MSDVTDASAAEAKGVLEAALLVAGEPVPVAQLAKLFDPALAVDTVRALLGELAQRLVGAQGRARAGRIGLALPGPARRATLSRPARAGKAAALLARGHGNAGDHRLSATRHPRRHRSDPRRRRVHERHQDARGPAMGRGRRTSRDAGPPGALRDDEDVPRRPRPHLGGGAASAGRARFIPPTGDA